MKCLPFFGIMLTRGVKLKKAISIITVIIWMISIFSFSNQQGESSSSTSKKVSKIIVNIIDIKHEYNEEKKQQIISNIEPYIRKLAHFSLYAIGGVLLMNVVRLFLLKENMQILTSSSIGILYAAIDEIHQLVIPGRSGKITDFLIDSLGILTGIMVFMLCDKVVKIIKEKIQKGEVK